MSPTDLWPLLQSDLLGVLLADDFIGTRAGLAVEPGAVESVVNTKLAKAVGAGRDGRVGVGFLVLPVERAEDDNPSLPGGPLKLTLTIQFVEHVTLNQAATGTRFPIRIYAARAAKILKLYTPVGFTQSLVPANPVISEFTNHTNKALRVGQVTFTALEADEMPLHRINRPQLAVSGTSFPYTITVTAPEAAAIYYTLDGSHPYAGNPTAVLYTGPVSVTESCLFRARAFGALETQLPSDTAAKYFPQP